MDTHIKVVGYLHLGLGLLSLCGGLGGLILIGVFGAMGGAAAFVEGGAGAGLLTGGILGIFLMIVLVSLLITSLPGILAGWGILQKKAWAPIVAVILSILHVANFPFGTALAVYTWWALLSKDGQAAYGLGKIRI